MSGWRDHFLNLTVEARREYARTYAHKTAKSDFKLGSLPYLPLYKTPTHSKAEIVDWAVDHRVTCHKDLIRAIAESTDENHPTIEEIRFLFGDFSTLHKEIYNRPGAKVWDGRMNDREFVQFCSRIHVKSLPSYLKIREEHPEFHLPPQSSVISRFGTWSLFMALVKSFDVDYQLDLYFRKSIAVGHSLTIDECDKLGIEVRYLKEILTDKLFRKLLYEKERWYRKNMPECFLTKPHVPIENRMHLERKHYSKKLKNENDRANQE